MIATFRFGTQAKKFLHKVPGQSGRAPHFSMMSREHPQSSPAPAPPAYDVQKGHRKGLPCAGHHNQRKTSLLAGPRATL